MLLLLWMLQDAPAVRESPCTMKHVEKAKWCEACKGIVTAAEWKKHQKEFGEAEAHQNCADIDICVKRWWQSTCKHKTVIADKASSCCGTKMEGKEHRAVIVYRCEGCKVTSPWKDKLTHVKDDHKQTLTRACESSGAAPHDK